MSGPGTGGPPPGPGSGEDAGAVWRVQQRQGHGKWSTRFIARKERQAHLLFEGLNAHGGWRKRLMDPDGEIVRSSHPTRRSPGGGGGVLTGK